MHFFGDNILSSQFFRDYADMEILRNIQPEDIEDVSERYVPLYSTERESDTVKKVNISKYLPRKENQLNLPLYIISLIEHKTKVEYNVVMQILRYMVYIWEDYEKEMTRQQPGISSRKDFRYPPILPIVYYEGERKWTASLDIFERILCGELLGKYLPHFRYQLVMLRDYSNEYLPDTMAKLLRALLYRMNLPEGEAEDVVSRIKERKMAKLFENVKMDIQAERRERAEAEEKLEEVEKKLEETAKNLEIYKLISKMTVKGSSENEIKVELMRKFSLSEELAEREYKKVLEEE